MAETIHPVPEGFKARIGPRLPNYAIWQTPIPTVSGWTKRGG